MISLREKTFLQRVESDSDVHPASAVSVGARVNVKVYEISTSNYLYLHVLRIYFRVHNLMMAT